MSEAARTGVYLRLLGMAIIWGGTFAAARAVALELPHFVAALLRHVFALAVLLMEASLLSALFVREPASDRTEQGGAS
jgi:hypothetical protein